MEYRCIYEDGECWVVANSLEHAKEVFAMFYSCEVKICMN
jgi:hypothetical protein